MSTSLNIAIFYELFWLDLIPVGTFIPPHLTAATFSALALTTYFGLESPGKIIGILFATMPLAWLGTKVDGMLREQERGSYNKLLNWARSPEPQHVPANLVMRSVVRTVVISWCSFYLAILALKACFGLLFSLQPGLLVSLDITWPHLWVAATLGGIMSLREKRAYVLLAAGVAVCAIFILLTRF